MSRPINKAIILGNLGSDPILRYTQKGVAFTHFSVATTKTFITENGDKKEETLWHRTAAWGKTAENCVKYLKKGSRVYLEGVMKPTTWTDKEGITHKGTEITISEINFLGGGRGRANESASSTETLAIMQ